MTAERQLSHGIDLETLDGFAAHAAENPQAVRLGLDLRPTRGQPRTAWRKSIATSLGMRRSPAKRVNTRFLRRLEGSTGCGWVGRWDRPARTGRSRAVGTGCLYQRRNQHQRRRQRRGYRPSPDACPDRFRSSGSLRSRGTQRRPTRSSRTSPPDRDRRRQSRSGSDRRMGTASTRLRSSPSLRTSI